MWHRLLGTENAALGSVLSMEMWAPSCVRAPEFPGDILKCFSVKFHTIKGFAHQKETLGQKTNKREPASSRLFVL